MIHFDGNVITIKDPNARKANYLRAAHILLAHSNFAIKVNYIPSLITVKFIAMTSTVTIAVTKLGPLRYS